jgi:hypothetical protein
MYLHVLPPPALVGFRTSDVISRRQVHADRDVPELPDCQQSGSLHVDDRVRIDRVSFYLGSHRPKSQRSSAGARYKSQAACQAPAKRGGGKNVVGGILPK